MKITITARHFKAPDKLKLYIENELTRLEKFYENIIEVEVILDYVKMTHSLQVVELVMKVTRQTLSVKADSEDWYKSVDFAIKKLERQLKKYKGRLKTFRNDKAVNHVYEPAFSEEE